MKPVINLKKSNLQIKVVYKCSCSFQTLKQATLLICNNPRKRLIEDAQL